MKRFLRVKLAGKPTVHIGTDDPKTGGYLSLCGKSLVGRTSAEPIIEYRGDECPRCQKKAQGKWVSVGGQPVAGDDWPGAVRYDRGTKLQKPILQRKKSD